MMKRMTLSVLLLGAAFVVGGCSSTGSGGGSPSGLTQDGRFLRDLTNEHIGTADDQFKRVGKDPTLVRKKSWNVLYCEPDPKSNGGGDFGHYGCACEGAIGACIHAWDSTEYGSFASTRLYAGPEPTIKVIRHEEAHATLATWADNPAEISNHPTGHPDWVTIGGKRYNVKRDIIPGIRWPLVFRAPYHMLNPFPGKNNWYIDGCGYTPPPLPPSSPYPVPQREEDQGDLPWGGGASMRPEGVSGAVWTGGGSVVYAKSVGSGTVPAPRKLGILQLDSDNHLWRNALRYLTGTATALALDAIEGGGIDAFGAASSSDDSVPTVNFSSVTEGTTKSTSTTETTSTTEFTKTFRETETKAAK